MEQRTQGFLIASGFVLVGLLLAVASGQVEVPLSPKAQINLLFDPKTGKCNPYLYIEDRNDGTLWLKDNFEVLFFSDCPTPHTVAIGGFVGNMKERRAVKCDKGAIEGDGFNKGYSVKLQQGGEDKLKCSVLQDCRGPLAYSICLDQTLLTGMYGPEVRGKPPRWLENNCPESNPKFKCPS